MNSFEKKIIVISPYKIYKNNLLFNLWTTLFYELDKYETKFKIDKYIYKYKNDDLDNQEFGYDDEIISNVINYSINPTYQIIIFVLCSWSGNKNKFLYSEENVLNKLVESNKKIVIINPDFFDLKLTRLFKHVIKKNSNFYILDSIPYEKIKETYNIPTYKFFPVTMMCNEIFTKINFNTNPTMKIFVPGNYDSYYYQERCYFIKNIYPKYQNYIDINEEHPGQITNNNKNTGENYANKLNKYFACFTSSVKNQCVILNKHIEIPAVGSLMLAYSTEKQILKDYGFIDRIHYISCDENNYDDTIKYIFDNNNRQKIDEIRKNGYNLVREKYTHKHVADKITSYMNYLYK